MKTIRRMIVSTIAASLVLFSSAAFAAEMWTEDYYRVKDTTGKMTEAEETSLDDLACEFVENYEYDIVMATVRDEDIETDLYDLIVDFYYDNDFGYGEDQDGLMMAFNTDTNEAEIVRFGLAEATFTDDYIDFVEGEIPKFYEKYGVYGAMYVFESYMEDYVVEVFEMDPLPSRQKNAEAQKAGIDTEVESDAAGNPLSSADPEGAEASSDTGSKNAAENKAEALLSTSAAYKAVKRVGAGDPELPSWFPADPENFKFYNDPDVPRVIDNADIFTDSEEAEMQELISRYAPELEKDIVIYTDTSTYGKGKDIISVDFYDFNGYGYGPENEGICLMICMDPSERGWWAAATGPKTRAVYTEDNANLLDDDLYGYMVSGHYGSGVTAWIENVYNLYTKGIIFAPDWYPEVGEEPARPAKDPAYPRIVDSADVFSLEEEDKLKEKAAALSAQLGIDVVIHTTDRSYSLGFYDYSDLFYDYQGYGFGENRDGILLTIYTDVRTIRITEGGGLKHYTEVNHSRLRDQTESLLEGEHYYDAADLWLRNVKAMETKGRVPRTMLSWLVSAIAGLLLGVIIGFIALRRAKKKMITVRLATNADAYIDGAPIVRTIADIFLTSRTITKKIERSSSSGSSGSSSSRSSYRSSYSGSSGRSHSGSGRSF